MTNITYNKDNLRKVFFNYENTTRPDKRMVYEQGNKFLESRRLIGIDVYFSTSLVRKYQLSYTDLNNEKTMTALSNISYLGIDGTSLLHSIIFDYYGSQSGFDSSPKWNVPEAFTSLESDSKDFGLRLVDVNNDGFMDLLKSSTTSTFTQLNDKNSTWNLTSHYTIPEQFVDADSKSQGVELTDVNKDGLVDILKAKASTRKTYLHNGTGWSLVNESFSIPVDFLNSSSDDEGVRFMELNGDGYIDIVQGKENGAIKKTWLSNGNGWIDVPLWLLPDYFVSSNGNDTDLREIDLNGDGLTDLLKGGVPGAAWLNNGTGFVSEPSYVPNLAFSNIENPDLGIRTMDVNGDDLPDILQNFFSNASIFNASCNCTVNNITLFTNVKINNGSGWIFSPEWQSPEAFTQNGYNTGRRIADVNGDGYSDIVIGYNNGSFEKKTWLKNVTSAFVLKSIRHEYGGMTSIVYNQSTFASNGQNLGFNTWIVRKILLNNSVNVPFAINARTTYDYSGGKFDYSNAEFLGFSNVNETLPDQSRIVHFFHQEDLLKGNEFLVQIFDNENRKIKSTINTFTNYSDNKIFLNMTSEQIFEGNQDPFITNISYKYDDFGNVVIANYSGDASLIGDEKIEQYEYFYNTTTYVLEKASNYSLFDSSMDLSRRTWFFYDALQNGVQKGDLTKVRNYNNLGNNQEVQYVYDSFGNVLQEVDALGNAINYTYDSATNTYPIQQKNALNHAINYKYDGGTGNVLFEQKDAFIRNFTYDAFGRIIKEFMIPDTESIPTKRTSYDFDGISPERIIVETKNNDTSLYSEITYFYDGFSNPVQIKSKYNTSHQIGRDFAYDAKFRIIEEKIPYFQAYSLGLNQNSTSFHVKYNYDALDRVINITKRDSSNAQILFNSTKVTAVNENGIKKEYLVDGFGRITNVSEFNRNSTYSDTIYNTSYFYDVTDNLIEIVDAQGNQFNFDYDSLGRKIRVDDPNMEPWTYGYDLNNNLINQTDGRGNIVFILYDKLNRPLNKSSVNTTLLFRYDNQNNGTLSLINFSTDIFDPGMIVYSYDSRIRLIGESLYFDYVPESDAITDGEFDYWINTTTSYDSSNKIIRKYLPNQSFDYRFQTGFNETIVTLFPNATLVYQYNLVDKVISIDNFVNEIVYSEFGSPLSKEYQNNLETIYQYDNQNRLGNISAGNVQNLSYDYDKIGNIQKINDTKNNIAYLMSYDELDRLVKTIIYDFGVFENEKFVYSYDRIGNLLTATEDTEGMNYTYTASQAHAPSGILQYNRSKPKIELNLIDPTSSKNVQQNKFFNFTVQACCRNNDCWGINVSLDPEQHFFTETTETTCDGNICSMVLYQDRRFVREDGEWVKIEDAKSLKDVWQVEIKEDPNFPAQVIDYDYNTITLELSVSKDKIAAEIPLRIYNRYDKASVPKNREGVEVSKDSRLLFENDTETKTITIDLSDIEGNLLIQEIKWGDASTIITINDNRSVNIGDTYVRNGGSANTNFGTESWIYLLNSTTEIREGLIKFDVSQLPSHALVDDADLFLYVDSNNLDAGESYNVSAHQIFRNYSWTETSVTWNSRPNISTGYNKSYLDKVPILSGETNKWFRWDVTQLVNDKNKNESFYIKAIENKGGSATDSVRFKTKENSGVQKPYLNITYRLKGLVSTTIGETPFYTTIPNPFYVDLEQNQCRNITWPVNATGSLGDYIFFAYANKTTNGNISNQTGLVNVKII